MCTAVSLLDGDFYFGRNLDLEYHYEESVVVTPRRYPLAFRHLGVLEEHYAMIGIAYVTEGKALYYEAVNEAGIGMAGLNFPENAVYHPFRAGKDNVAPYEIIPWILGRCGTLAEVREALATVSLLDEPFSAQLPLTPLHWFIGSREGSLAVESVAGGLQVYEDRAGVLTNNPEFPWHRTNLCNYMSVTSGAPECRFGLHLTPYSRGMGGIGLPGDLSSASRFVRAAFGRLNSAPGDTEGERVSQFFHILDSVAMEKGCVDMGDGKFEITIYSCCCNATKGIFYYTSYGNSRVTAVDLHRAAPEGSALTVYPLLTEWDVKRQN